MNNVVAGDYKGYILTTNNVFGNVSAFLMPQGFKGLKKDARINCTPDTVKEINEKINNMDRSVGGSIAKELVFGIGASTAKKAKITIEVVFTDGKKSLIQTDNKNYQNLIAACYK